MESKLLGVAFGLYAAVSSFFIVRLKLESNKSESVRSESQDSILYLNNPMFAAGTGFVVKGKSGKKYIITNGHVCDATKGSFSVSKRNKYGSMTYAGESEAITQFDKNDLCLARLPVDIENAPALDLAYDIKTDERSYIVGYPLLPLLSVTVGHIRGITDVEEVYPLITDMHKCVGEKYSVKVAEVETPIGIKMAKVCILHAKGMFSDTPTDHGASGSPILNAYGEVVGVVMMSAGTISYSLAVPLEDIKEFLSAH